ncbi:hypothetical protein AGABI2DRAFT_180621 [Agaricus bisporus var. bisporus H97]|uniref:hypothetical protein n=1 Tax=Agaricus bisporus var. bisporus (strain H97 / ATCC MYA-4626 / FGSC 10389) TaxID=936046 RepID=UPI00029F61A0|nr:hypothetical protein AGABI2DRAFT_180621 [Agaricus bisporus var. bisporus H97]EKV43449.1 hypothetical protein AGABI2DRAFT_180621 [Agaricus bisporus var. bisporus H97]
MIFNLHSIAVFIAATASLTSGVNAAPQAANTTLARVVRSCTKDKVAALTFDDGPTDYTIIAEYLLTKAGAKGTFFVNGALWGCIYDQRRADTVKILYDRGHQIGSHTWSHPDLTLLSRDEIVPEMTRSHVAIERITGASPAFMRPPYGEYNSLVQEVAASLGETIALWDLDPEDTTDKDVAYQRKQYDDAVNRKVKNVLSLQHDIKSQTVYLVLPYVIKKLQDAGYKLVTLAECLGEQPYSKIGSPQQRTTVIRSDGTSDLRGGLEEENGTTGRMGRFNRKFGTGSPMGVGQVGTREVEVKETVVVEEATGEKGKKEAEIKSKVKEDMVDLTGMGMGGSLDDVNWYEDMASMTGGEPGAPEKGKKKEKKEKEKGDKK